MKFVKEIKGIYKFKEEVPFIWKKHQEQFNSEYKVVKGYIKKEPVYRDDYIEPYDYKYIDYVLIEDIKTGKQTELNLVYFNRFFIRIGE